MFWVPPTCPDFQGHLFNEMWLMVLLIFFEERESAAVYENRVDTAWRICARRGGNAFFGFVNIKVKPFGAELETSIQWCCVPWSIEWKMLPAAGCDRGAYPLEIDE